jgi:hypothetical protein
MLSPPGEDPTQKPFDPNNNLYITFDQRCNLKLALCVFHHCLGFAYLYLDVVFAANRDMYIDVSDSLSD